MTQRADAALAADLLGAFSCIGFEFDDDCPSAGDVLYGFAGDGVIEIAPTIDSTVSLLLGMAGESPARMESEVRLAVLAETVRVPFMEWLGGQIHERGLDQPWHASRSFDGITVCAEHLCLGALLVSIHGGLSTQ